MHHVLRDLSHAKYLSPTQGLKWVDTCSEESTEFVASPPHSIPFTLAGFSFFGLNEQQVEANRAKGHPHSAH